MRLSVSRDFGGNEALTAAFLNHHLSKIRKRTRVKAGFNAYR
jgi:hypothetical protein